MAIKCQGFQIADDYFITAYQDNQASGSVTGASATVKDITYSTDVAAQSFTKVSYEVATAIGNPEVVATSLTPAICSVSGSHVTASGAGVCSIEFDGKTGKKQFNQTVASAGGLTTYNAITAYGANSLRKYLDDQMTACLAGVAAGVASQAAFNAGYSALNSGNFLLRRGVTGFDDMPLDILEAVLATPGAWANSRVWISNHHYLTGLGALHGTGEASGRKAIGVDSFVWYSATEWTGSVAKVINPYQEYLPDSASVQDAGSGIMCFVRAYNTYGSSNYWVMPAYFTYNTLDAAHPLYAYQRHGTGDSFMTGGDSGSPVFCGVGGDLVILSHVAVAGVVGADKYGALKTSIDTAMNTLATENSDPAAGTYAVGVATLAGFTSYP